MGSLRRFPGCPSKWNVLALTVSAVSIGWVVAILVRSWPEMRDALSNADKPILALGATLTLLGSYILFETFRSLARELGFESFSRRRLGHLYFTAQLFKHLPGRIWGVGYQIAAGRSSASIEVWMLANAAHILLATYFALAAAFVAIAAARGWMTGVLALIACYLAYLSAWRVAASQIVRDLTQRIPGKSGRALVRAFQALSNISAKGRIELLLKFSAHWFVMYLAWILFALAYPSLGPADGVRLLALYMAAWFVGYVSLISPSGLGVRELVFVALAHGTQGDAVAFMVIVGRVALLINDMLLAAAFALYTEPSGPRSG